MPGLPYNLFLNATFAQSLSGFVGEDGGGYRLAPIRIGCPELKIGKFRRGHTQQRDMRAEALDHSRTTEPSATYHRFYTSAGVNELPNCSLIPIYEVRCRADDVDAMPFLHFDC